MKSAEIAEKFIDFFVSHGHQEVGQISLLPENDPTLLFTSAGMVQFKPYFLGLEKPPARRLVNVQRCLRTTDIDKVGKDARTLSFFEMLGSWSIGDYFKEEAIQLAWEFLTQSLGFVPQDLWATYFAGDKDLGLAADKESKKYWQQVGMKPDHLVGLGREENFWQAAQVGPCGPSTEVYLDRGREFGCGEANCQPGCDCDRFIEIWNAGVFMQFDQQEDGTLTPLPLKSVDTGAGLERLAMILQGVDSVFQIHSLKPIVDKACTVFSCSWGKSKKVDQALGKIVDHLRAATFLAADGLIPANNEEGYILRRLIRQSVYAASQLKEGELPSQLIPVIVTQHSHRYPYLTDRQKAIEKVVQEEEQRFLAALKRGRGEIKKIIAKANQPVLTGQKAFYIKETFGVPVDITKEEFRRAGFDISSDFANQLQTEMDKHRQRSKTNDSFKGGLADESAKVTRLHTATHLLHAALRNVLGNHVHQVGSNINKERLRFDFTNPKALTEEELQQVTEQVNQIIEQDLPVQMQTMSLSAAEEQGALAFFSQKYDKNKVKVYQIGDFSKEVCGGPHVEHTGQLSKFIINKEKSVGAGKRRIYATVETD